MKALLLAALFAASASAKEGGHVKPRLLVAGKEAALEFVHAPHWHTYWINPGDSGLVTKMTGGALEFPAPIRLVAGPLTSFGYEGRVLIPAVLTAKKAVVTWLECAEVCIPGKAELSPVPGDAAELAAARAALPRPEPSAATARREGRNVVLVVEGRHPRAEFFPLQPGVFDSARGEASVSPAGTELTLKPADGAEPASSVSGVLVRPGLPPAVIAVPVGAAGGILRAIALAFLGGLILNLMPCVFPVLAIKITGLLKRPGTGHAAAYSAGVVASFLVLAGALIAARAAGAKLGWGFQLQSPWVVGALAALFVAIGLNLLGFFEVGTRIMSIGAKAGESSAFASGVFAVVVSAPCTAPFMGAALGWALSRPAHEALAVFGALGVGTAVPYAVLASFPALLKLLPKPGAWMETLKKALSIPMFATALWLLWVLSRLLGSAGAAGDWKPWSPQAVSEARASGKTVFVDFTAAWCLSCQVNERLILEKPEVSRALDKAVRLKADWTDKNDAIAQELAKHGRAGVPLYIVYPRGGDAVTLPEILTPGLVLDALEEK